MAKENDLKSMKSIFREPAKEPEEEKAPSRQSKIQQAADRSGDRSEVIRDAIEREKFRETRQREKTDFFSAWATLESAMRRNWVLYGKVIMIRTREFHVLDFENTGVFIVLSFEENGVVFHVTMPFKDIYRDFPIDKSTVDLETEDGRRDYIRRQKAMAEKLQDLEMPFCITNMSITDPENGPDSDYSIFVSRVRALDAMERRNFAPRGDRGPEMKVGDFVEASVTSTSRYAIAVEVGGVDVRIPVGLLTYDYIGGDNKISNKYRLGQKIKVQILEVNERPDGHYSLVVSRRAAELEEAKRVQRNFPLPENGRGGDVSAIGIVTSVKLDPERSNTVNMMMYLDKLKLPAYANGVTPKSMGYTPRVGDLVRVTLLEYRANGMTKVRCNGVHDGLSRDSIVR